MSDIAGEAPPSSHVHICGIMCVYVSALTRRRRTRCYTNGRAVPVVPAQVWPPRAGRSPRAGDRGGPRNDCQPRTTRPLRIRVTPGAGRDPFPAGACFPNPQAILSLHPHRATVPHGACAPMRASARDNR